MTYATLLDVADELGRSSISDPGEVAQVNAWLRRAEATIKVRVPDLDSRIASGALSTEVVAGVEAAIVARKVLNPEGKQNERIDDYSYGRVEAAATVDLEPTPGEWALLLPAPAKRGAFTIRPA